MAKREYEGDCLQSYDLILEIQKSVNRLEDKIDVRLINLEKKVDENESKLDIVVGRIGIVVAIVTMAVSGLVSFVFDYFKSHFKS